MTLFNEWECIPVIFEHLKKMLMIGKLLIVEEGKVPAEHLYKSRLIEDIALWRRQAAESFWETDNAENFQIVDNWRETFLKISSNAFVGLSTGYITTDLPTHSRIAIVIDV